MLSLLLSKLAASPFPRRTTQAALAQQRLEPFYEQVWSAIIEPATPFLSNWHIGLIAEHLEAVSAGQITRLLINMPPRYGKSSLLSVAWPAWEWIRRPDSRWIFASFRADLATKHSTDRRLIIESPWYQQHWGHVFRISGDNNLKTYFENDRRGHMLACSITSPPTGQGCTRLVIDDPHDPLHAESRELRQQQIKSFGGSLYTRLDDKQTSAIVIVMQRLHALDLSAHVLQHGDREYEKVCLAAEAEERTKIVFPRDGKVLIREKGDILWPQREGPEILAQHRRALGSYGYAGQFQQRPAPEGGGLFKRQWFRFWRHDPLDAGVYRLYSHPPAADHDTSDTAQLAWNTAGDTFTTVARSDCQIVATLDVAGSDAESADFSVLQIWAMTPAYQLLLLHQWRAQAQLPDVIKSTAKICHDRGVEILGVEKNGVGLAVFQTLRRSGLSVRGLNATTDKIMRARPAMIRMEGGQIFFPAEDAPWLADLVEELESFPNSATKDQVDALAWAAHFAHQFSRGENPAAHKSAEMIERSEKIQEAERARREREDRESAIEEVRQRAEWPEEE